MLTSTFEKFGELHVSAVVIAAADTLSASGKSEEEGEEHKENNRKSAIHFDKVGEQGG